MSRGATTAEEAHALQYFGQEVLLLIIGALGFAALHVLSAGRLDGEPDKVTPDNLVPEKATIFVFDEAKGFTFALGSAEPTLKLRQGLERIAPDIVRQAVRHRLNLVEVVGHTDDVRVNTRAASNLDRWLGEFQNGERLATDMKAVDNTGLAMLRAVAVTRYLQSLPVVRDAKLTVVPLSAGQLIGVDGHPISPEASANGEVREDASRRRIELRLRRLGE